MKTIQEAKKDLEQKIISNPHVVGIGVIDWNNETFIEVSVKDEPGKNDITRLIPDGHWDGHPVKIKVRNQSTLL